MEDKHANEFPVSSSARFSNGTLFLGFFGVFNFLISE